MRNEVSLDCTGLMFSMLFSKKLNSSDLVVGKGLILFEY